MPKLFVATNGNDGWTGTSPGPNVDSTDGPFATLERARDELRALKSTVGLGEGAVVYVRGGVYYRTNIFVLEENDSGTPAARIVYQAYMGEKPVICGGLPVTNFLSWQGEVLQARTWEQGFAGMTFNQLFFDGRRQELARYPNRVAADPYHSGWLYVDGAVTNMYEDLPNDSRGSFGYKEGDIHAWAHPEECEVILFPRYNWWNDILTISNIDAAQRTIYLKGNASFAIRPGDRYYVRNALEELDAPGEWYLDPRTGVLYFWPPYSEASAQVIAPVIDTLLIVGGGEITIQGLTFECSVGPAIGFNGTTNCVLASCTVRNCGGAGVVVNGYTNQVVGNDVYFTGGEGIRLVGGTTETLTPGGNVAENNCVHHVGVFAKKSAGIALSGVGNTARCNLIYECPRWGIGLAGNNNVAEFNRVTHVNLEVDDTGAIVTAGGDWIMSRGNTIRFNEISDSQGFGFHSGTYGAAAYACGIYLDVNATGVDVIGNVVSDCSRSAVMLNNGRDNYIVNNVFYNAGREQVTYTGWRGTDAQWLSYLPAMLAGYDSIARQPAWRAMRGMSVGPMESVLADGLIMAGNQFVQNIVVYSNVQAQLYSLSEVAYAANQWNSNVIFHAGQAIQLQTNYETLSFSDWRQMEQDGKSVVADPRFVNPGGGDYQLQPDSPALALGFRPLPLSGVGPYWSPLRASWPVAAPVADPDQQVKIDSGQMVLSIQTVAGYSYQLQQSDSLEPTAWRGLGPPQEGTGRVLNFQEPLNLSVGAQFYRIEIYP